MQLTVLPAVPTVASMHCTAQNNRGMCLLIFPLLLLVFPLSLSFRLSSFWNSVSSQFISPELFKLINKSARSFAGMCVCMYLQSKLHYKNCQVINLYCVHCTHTHSIHKQHLNAKIITQANVCAAPSSNCIRFYSNVYTSTLDSASMFLCTQHRIEWSIFFQQN